MDIDKIKSEYIKNKQTEIIKRYLSELNLDNIQEKIKESISRGNKYRHTIILNGNINNLIDMNQLVSRPLWMLNIDRNLFDTKYNNMSIVDVLRSLISLPYDVHYGYGRTTWSDCHFIEIYDVNEIYCNLF
jgi:hypothetical protein